MSSLPDPAVPTHAIGPSPLGQPSSACVRLEITESQAAKIGLEDRWRIAHQKMVTRRQRVLDAETRLKQAVNRLSEHAAQQHWSQRRLARQMQLSWGTWLRCRAGTINARAWLPRLETALARLQPV